MSKGKEHKKYEFGSKASVVMTKTHGVIVGAVAHQQNLYDGDALRPALEQTRAINDLTGFIFIGGVQARAFCPSPCPRNKTSHHGGHGKLSGNVFS